jgi:hypothetical protein
MMIHLGVLGKNDHFNVILVGSYKVTITSTIERIQRIQKEKKTPCNVVTITNHGF